MKLATMLVLAVSVVAFAADTQPATKPAPTWTDKFVDSVPATMWPAASEKASAKMERDQLWPKWVAGQKLSPFKGTGKFKRFTTVDSSFPLEAQFSTTAAITAPSGRKYQLRVVAVLGIPSVKDHLQHVKNNEAAAEKYKWVKVGQECEISGSVRSVLVNGVGEPTPTVTVVVVSPTITPLATDSPAPLAKP